MNDCILTQQHIHTWTNNTANIILCLGCTNILNCCNLITTLQPFGFAISQFESVFVLPDINSSTHEHDSKENCLCMDDNHTLSNIRSSNNTKNLILYFDVHTLSIVAFQYNFAFCSFCFPLEGVIASQYMNSFRVELLRTWIINHTWSNIRS